MVTGGAATPIDASGAADRACVARPGADHRTGRCGPVPAASRPDGPSGPGRCWSSPPRRRPRCGPGWVGIAQKTGFGLVSPLPGIWPSLHPGTAITLPVRIELVAPGHFPAEWEQWPSTVRASIVRQREPGQWYLLFKGVATYNGYGDPLDASRAGQIAQAFRPPLCFAQVHTAGFYDDAGFCQDCDVPYCYRHWQVSQSGYGYCPRGHGKSLDPHW